MVFLSCESSIIRYYSLCRACFHCLFSTGSDAAELSCSEHQQQHSHSKEQVPDLCIDSRQSEDFLGTTETVTSQFQSHPIDSYEDGMPLHVTSGQMVDPSADDLAVTSQNSRQHAPEQDSTDAGTSTRSYRALCV